MHKHDLAIVGGGAGGLVVASVAAQLGLDVALIERQPQLGGDCLHTGCVPSKALLHAAGLRHQCALAERLGLGQRSAATDMRRVTDSVRSVIARIQEHDDPQRFRDYGCTVRFGTARFEDARRLSVDGQPLAARRFVLATGSRAQIPPIPGLADCDYLTNETVFALQQLPGRLAVLGGGPVGVELAQAFARLGSRVTLLEQRDTILGDADAELATELAACLREEGVTLHLSARVERVTPGAADTEILCSDGSRIRVDRVLVALGRQPDVEALNLPGAGVRYDRRGVQVDARQRTSQKHIFACGDVCGPWPFTHMAEYQAGVVISNAVFRFPRKSDYRVVPRVTYSDPELAQVGLTEAQARARGMPVKVMRFPVPQIDRALIEGYTRGINKLVVSGRRIVGASLLGPHAGELIHEVALAMQARLSPAKLSATIHAYPTLAQLHRRTVNSAYAETLFSPRVKWLVGVLNRCLS